jgi:8-oxo-dGTP diphosphatase
VKSYKHHLTLQTVNNTEKYQYIIAIRFLQRMATYKYPRPATTVDIIVFTIRNQRLHILLINRGIEPFKGVLALPGGFVNTHETLFDAAQRELREETHITDFHLKMFGIFDGIDRDPRDRVLSVGFYAIIPTNDIIVEAGSDAENADWYVYEDLPLLAFDHNEIVELAFKTLITDLENSSLPSKFLETEFTLAEFQKVYEIILTKEVDKRNFRKWINSTDYFIKTDKLKSGGQHRPAALYKINNHEEESSNNSVLAPHNVVSQITEAPSDQNYQQGYENGFQQALNNVAKFIGNEQAE